MALFPRCNNPVPVAGRHGITLVGCHSCIQCRVAAQEHLCKILEVEASKHSYVEFFTLTYDDMHLPYIDSILHRTYQNFELIVINDGSKDNTLEKLKKYINKNKIVIISIENNGVSNARNLGIKNSKGDYICFIDSDDWVEKE